MISRRTLKTVGGFTIMDIKEILEKYSVTEEDQKSINSHFELTVLPKRTKKLVNEIEILQNKADDYEAQLAGNKNVIETKEYKELEEKLNATLADYETLKEEKENVTKESKKNKIIADYQAQGKKLPEKILNNIDLNLEDDKLKEAIDAELNDIIETAKSLGLDIKTATPPAQPFTANVSSDNGKNISLDEQYNALIKQGRTAEARKLEREAREQK